MKIAAFSVGDFEVPFFERLNKEYGCEMELYKEEIVDTKVDLSIYDAISLIAIKKVTNDVIDRLSNCKIIALRSIGSDYIDLNYCKEKGIVVTNASYAPYNVADFTIMLMMMTLRKAKISVCRALVNDFSLDSLMGKELRSQTIGIIGTGKIGSTVIKELQGFGCKILCHDLYQNPSLEGLATYVSLDELYKECDIISLHMPLTKDNYHMINKETLSKMKDGIILINTARGGLCDTEALIEGVESCHIGALALDTIEGEEGLAHIAIGTAIDGLASKKNIMYLKQFANVIFTSHYAFFTEEASFSMVECSYKAIFASGDIPNRIN